MSAPAGGAAAASFCCAGCEAAHALIQGLGLDRYYRQRALASIESGPRPDPAAALPELESFVRTGADGTARLHLLVDGIQCGACLWLIERLWRVDDGILRADANLVRRTVTVWFQPRRLSLRAGETAELRLAPTPGLLSASLPAAALKYYPGLGGIEMGTVPLKATLLEVAFTPQGDAEGRTAMVHLIGGPVDPTLTAPIDLNVNVRGPLETLIKFGSRLRFGGN